MNKRQRIVLLIGAVALVLVAAGTPAVQYGGDGVVFRRNNSSRLASVADWRTAMVWGSTVLGVTGLIWLALKD